MNVLTKRLALTGALLIAGAGLTACGGTAGTTPEKAPAPVSAATTLKKGVPGSDTPAFRYTIKGGQQSSTGVLDAPNKSVTSDFFEKIPDSEITLTMRFLVIEKQAWARISFDNAPSDAGLPRLPKKWMKLDQGKLAKDSAEDLAYAGETDPGFVSTLLAAATGLKETGAGTYAGITDLTRSTEAGIVAEGTLKALGEKAKTVPLEVTLDGAGRVTKAVVKIPAAGKAKAATYEVVYDQYGKAAPIKAPSDAVNAPADAYELLNG
ncbi:hypothetical protein Aph02nite_74450 [Actinoplanes philippinensis]|uniref:Lipoprotein LprG n=1 Tax=Actinoplanes philippinensis TaxID=35752 RepID=A0A1I2K4X0_9ACTN|nr:hypothetical protein [Actinoplanes philippinensis]GIE81495.1 hypothetical protein Aph02nite_74450 [Actinoplanes philippinensis]SFF61954.1 hypothetical protein SAMN05421541_115104 [Actinoplanes philippinensis]